MAIKVAGSQYFGISCSGDIFLKDTHVIINTNITKIELKYMYGKYVAVDMSFSWPVGTFECSDYWLFGTVAGNLNHFIFLQTLLQWSIEDAWYTPQCLKSQNQLPLSIEIGEVKFACRISFIGLFSHSVMDSSLQNVRIQPSLSVTFSRPTTYRNWPWCCWQ